MLSRLKGIETKVIASLEIVKHLPLYMLSRLKGIETWDVHPFTMDLVALYMLSRLKGIETSVSVGPIVAAMSSLCICFPV